MFALEREYGFDNVIRISHLSIDAIDIGKHIHIFQDYDLSAIEKCACFLNKLSPFWPNLPMLLVTRLIPWTLWEFITLLELRRKTKSFL